MHRSIYKYNAQLRLSRSRAKWSRTILGNE